MDQEKAAFAERLARELQTRPASIAIKALAEAVAFLVDRRDIAEVETWVNARAEVGQ